MFFFIFFINNCSKRCGSDTLRFPLLERVLLHSRRQLQLAKWFMFTLKRCQTISYLKFIQFTYNGAQFLTQMEQMK